MSRNLVLGIEYMKWSVAPSTWSRYVSAWMRWCIFANLGWSIHVCSEFWALAFCLQLFKEHLAYVSVVKILAGVSFFLRLSIAKPFADYFLIKQMSKGYKKGNHLPDQRSPISSILLFKLCVETNGVCVDHLKALWFSFRFVAYFWSLQDWEAFGIELY